MIKLLSLVFIFVAWRIFNFFLSKKEKERNNRFRKYTSDIESKVNSIHNIELAQLRKEITKS
jgi:hypothetical protein